MMGTPPVCPASRLLATPASSTRIGWESADNSYGMNEQEQAVDFYEVLQASPIAEPEMIHRIYRLLAQRFHPDNQETGDPNRFRIIHEAYLTLSDPEKRAKYDVWLQQQKQNRWRLISTGQRAEDDFEFEQITRLTVLEALHAKRRQEPGSSGIAPAELEQLIGRPREHLEFTVWYLAQKKLVQRDDSAQLMITADGVD
ncbi:MAG: J domain-containing protein, partial [Acidobacteria bacterium]